MEDGYHMSSRKRSSTSITVVNRSEVPTSRVMDHLRESPVFATLSSWADGLGSMREGSLIDRDKFVTPGSLKAQFDLAEWAVENDNVVGGIADITEDMAYTRVTVRCGDAEQDDIWAQILNDLDLETRLKEIWRELYTYSNCYIGTYWGVKSYKVRAKTTTGKQSKKTYDKLRVPLGVTIFDPRNVVPYGNFMFGAEDLAYVAKTRDEAAALSQRTADNSDAVIRQLFAGQADLSLSEISDLKRESGITFHSGGTFRLNPERCFRITGTRPAYKRFAPVRLKSVFELLDLKAQLREMDRSHLLGSANFIVLVTKGSDSLPASVREMEGVSGQFSEGLTRVPIIIGDHRLDIKIITPELTYVLSDDKWRLLDSLISIRLFQLFHQVGDTREGDTKLMKVVTQGLESRRDQIRRQIQRSIIDPIYETNPKLTLPPQLNFHPRRITMSFDSALATAMENARTLGDISRTTYLLDLFDLEQEEELALRREEAETDEMFPPTPNPVLLGGQELAGRLGGNNNGGGKQPPSGKQKADGRIGGGNSNGGGDNLQNRRDTSV